MTKICLDSAKSGKRKLGSAKNRREIKISNMLCEEENMSTTYYALQMCPGEQQVYVIDTGCFKHMFPSSYGMIGLKKSKRLVWSANGTIIPTTCVGLVKLDTGNGIVMILKDVLAVPELKLPLISVAAFLDTRIKFVFNQKECNFYNGQ
jgi:hypothetical protein